MSFENTAPVKEGEELDVKIETLGTKDGKPGDGIAKVDRFTIFVPDTKIGDQVKIRINKVLPKFAFAEVVGG